MYVNLQNLIKGLINIFFFKGINRRNVNRFLEAYDDNQDGKIDIRELAQLLPMGNTIIFLTLFYSHHIAT